MAKAKDRRKGKGKTKNARHPISYPPPEIPPDERHMTPGEMTGLSLSYARRDDFPDALLVRRIESALVRPGQKYQEQLVGPPPDPAVAKNSEERKQLQKARKDWYKERRRQAKRKWATPVYYTKPIDIAAILTAWGDRFLDNTLKFIVRWVQIDLSPLLDHHHEVRKLGNRSYKTTIDELTDMALPAHDRSMNYGIHGGRDLILWGTTEAMFGAQQYTAYRGRIPTIYEAGSFFRAVINRTEMRFDEGNPNALLVSVPPVREDIDFLIVNDVRHTYFMGRVLPQHLDSLLTLPVDIYVDLEREPFGAERAVYLTTLVRVTDPLTSQGMPFTDFVSSRLRYMGHWEKVRGSDSLWRAFRAFWPGSPSMHEYDPLRKFRASAPAEPEPAEFINSFVATVNGAPALQGKSFLGFELARVSNGEIGDNEKFELVRTGNLVTINREELQHALLVGKGQRGKTLASDLFLGAQETPTEWDVFLTTAGREAASRWVVEHSGTTDSIVEIDKPDLNSIEEQEKAMLEDEQEAIMAEEENAKLWWETGSPIGVTPNLIRPVVQSFRYHAYWLARIKRRVELWEHWTVPPNESSAARAGMKEWERGKPGYRWLPNGELWQHLAILKIQDLGGSPSPTEDLTLKSISVRIAFQIRDFLTQAPENLHKSRVYLVITAHSIEEVKAFKAGFPSSFQLGMLFKTTFLAGKNQLIPNRHVIAFNPAKPDEEYWLIDNEVTSASLLEKYGRQVIRVKQS